jgi:hypothetical protein
MASNGKTFKWKETLQSLTASPMFSLNFIRVTISLQLVSCEGFESENELASFQLTDKPVLHVGEEGKDLLDYIIPTFIYAWQILNKRRHDTKIADMQNSLLSAGVGMRVAG